MKKVAVFADVHGNSSALRAVLDEIDKDGQIEHIFCLGDMIGIGPETNEVLEMLFSRDDVSMTLGNHEIDVLSILDGKDLGSRGEEREHQEWIAKSLDSRYSARLLLLPLVLLPMTHGHRLMMLHYHLHTNGKFYSIDQDPSGEKLDLWYKGCEASVVCFGHHHPVHFFKTSDRTYANPGSLGCCDRAIARYAVLSVEDNVSVEVELREVPYDNRSFLALYEKLDVPARDFIVKVFHGGQTP